MALNAAEQFFFCGGGPFALGLGRKYPNYLAATIFIHAGPERSLCFQKPVACMPFSQQNGIPDQKSVGGLFPL
jgi:hypothetical protein